MNQLQILHLVTPGFQEMLCEALSPLRRSVWISCSCQALYWLLPGSAVRMPYMELSGKLDFEFLGKEHGWIERGFHFSVFLLGVF